MSSIIETLHHYDEHIIKEAMTTLNPRKVMLQFPEGLTAGVFFKKIMKLLRDEWPDVQLIIAGNPSYGACDLALEEASLQQADLLIHFGHSLFRSGKRDWPLVVQMKQGKNKINVLHVPIRLSINLQKIIRRVEEELRKRNWKNIGIFTTIQHVHDLPEIKRMLDRKGFITFIEGTGQILGCDVHLASRMKARVDGFLCIAGGVFHAKGISIGTGGKPTIVIDPFTFKVHEYTPDDFQRFLRQRWASIEKARKAKTWGIVSSTKQGQMNLVQSRLAERWLKDEGKEVYQVMVNDFTPHIAMNFADIEAWVNTACPRLNIDDAPRFHVPVIDINELAVVLGKKSWEDHLKQTYIPWRNL